MKVAIAPGVWRDEGPQSATAGRSNYAQFGSPVGSMTPPPASSPLPITAAERDRRNRKSEQRRNAQKDVDRPVCGAVMRLAETTCARRPNHRDSHLSRAAMDADMKSRRAA